jgi:hypothetical protein
MPGTPAAWQNPPSTRCSACGARLLYSKGQHVLICFFLQKQCAAENGKPSVSAPSPNELSGQRTISRDEARRIPVNIAKPSELLRKD